MNNSLNYFNKIIILIILKQLIFIILNIEARKVRTNNDFVFPTMKVQTYHLSDRDFHFPKDEISESNNIQNQEYNLCNGNSQSNSFYNEMTCKKYHNTENGKWWKPKPQNNSKFAPDGYSGFNPFHWRDHVHAYNQNGERERRKSELKFQEYIESIYGRGNYDENKILTPAQLNGREIADPGQFPHVAAIGVRQADRTKSWFCTGSLLSENFVVTAAHCTSVSGEAPNFVKLGDINLNQREEVVATQRFRIETIHVHPDYNADLNYHDIALLKLAKQAVFTRHVHPIRMWPQRDIPYLIAFAMGYGATEFARIPTGVLSFLNFTLIGNKECNSSLENIPETVFGIIDNQICAVNLNSSADICQGDSGGPLQLHLPGSERAKYFLIGITSYGAACGSGLPSVYTRVYSYLEWIENIVWPDD